MKRTCFILFTLATLLATQEAFGQRRSFGLGVMAGEPTGLSAKLWTSRTNAFDFGLGWSTYSNKKRTESHVHFHMDYLWHSFNAISASHQVPLYYGLGGRYRSNHNEDGSLALRGVLGIAWMPRNTPLDIFLEVAPTLELTQSSGLSLDAAIGIRYYF